MGFFALSINTFSSFYLDDWCSDLAITTPSTINKTFIRLREKAGITSEIKSYAARYYYATQLFRGGVEERLVMQAGGWTDVKSVRRYAHVSNQQIRDVADKVGAIFS